MNVNPTAPTIVAIYNQMQADSLALANQIAAERAHLDDTLSHYLMEEVQVLSIGNDTIYLTGGSFVKLPAGFSGDYNDLVNKPTNVSAFNNDAGYLTQEVQVLSVSNDTLWKVWKPLRKPSKRKTLPTRNKYIYNVVGLSHLGSLI